MRFLDEDLERQKLSCQRLEKEKTRLERRCVSLETERKDAVEYLKTELLDKEDELERLTERLDQSLQEAQGDREVLQQRMEKEIRELREHVQRLEGDNTGLTVRLMAVECFEKQKEQLMSDMAAAQKKLNDQEEEHKDALCAVNKKAHLEKCRLEKALETAAADAALAIDRLVEEKLPEASRRVALENREVTARYAHLCERAHQLARENQTLRQQRGHADVEVTILEETVAKMARRSCVRKKVVQQLEADLEERHTELEALRKSHTCELGHLEAELHKAQKKIGQLEEVVNSLKPSLLDEDVLQWKQQAQKHLASSPCIIINRTGKRGRAQPARVDKNVPSRRVTGGAGAHPSCLQARGRGHPESVASQSQGTRRQTTMHIHTHI
ncbi:cilia- and flagella-associated protein 157-like isoform X3 [Stigmatopora nigra]